MDDPEELMPPGPDSPYPRAKAFRTDSGAGVCSVIGGFGSCLYSLAGPGAIGLALIGLMAGVVAVSKGNKVVGIAGIALNMIGLVVCIVAIATRP